MFLSEIYNMQPVMSGNVCLMFQKSCKGTVTQSEADVPLYKSQVT